MLLARIIEIVVDKEEMMMNISTKKDWLLLACFNAALLTGPALGAGDPQGSVSTAVEHQPEDIKAAEIIRRMADVYRNASSYADSGVSTTTFIREKGNRVTETPFKTRFVRPDRFRFEFSSRHPHPKFKKLKTSVVYHDGDQTLTQYHYESKPKRSRSLNLALAGATGVSSGSAHTVPSMLMPDTISGRMINDARNHRYKMLEDGQMDGKQYYRIEVTAKNKKARSEIIWIDQQTYLLYRLDTQATFKDFSTKTTRTYRPRVNVAIPDIEMDFNPPKKAR